MEAKQIEEILNSEGEQGAKIDLILKACKEELESELNAIKINREEIKKEKTQIQAKFQALTDEAEKLKKDNASLAEKLKSSAPEEIQKVYEQRIADAAAVYEKQLTETAKDRDMYKQLAEEAERLSLRLDIRAEFDKAIEGKNIAPDALTDFATFVLGLNCEKFSKKPLGDGKEVFANKEGRTIEQTVKDALETSFGKRCVQVMSSGGGAEGAGWGHVPDSENPFITGNITQQAILYKADKEKYDRLEREAKASGKYKGV